MARVLSLLLGLSLVACSADLSPLPRDYNIPEIELTPMDSAAREEYLKVFPIVNLQGREAAPQITENGIAPFGVLLKLTKEGKPSACTVTHLWPGWVVTSAHCVIGHKKFGARNFFVVHFNKSLVKVHVPLESIAYVGNQNQDDVAILKISEADSQSWDSLGSELNTLGGSSEISMWSFDPVDREDGGTAMAFAPKRCLGSTKKPEVIGVRSNGRRDSVLGQVKLDPGQHLFVDHCTSTLVSGNSGSLITASGQPKKAFGVYHWAITPTAQAGEFQRFEYLGNSGITEILPNPPADGLFFGVGSILRWRSHSSLRGGVAEVATH